MLFLFYRVCTYQGGYLLGLKGKTPKKDFRITIRIAVDEEVFSITYVCNTYIQKTALRIHGLPATQSRRTFVVSSSARTKDIKEKI